ncbi:phage replication protein [Neisseria weaveri]|nr:replication initiation factor domain-containing protein [Neisseria weaveri]SAY50685.1 phage replication protein [Neisseria weaveri]
MRGEQMAQIEYFSHFITDERGKLIEIPQRRGRQDGVFIDWLSITFHEDTLVKEAGCPLVADRDYMYVLSKKLEDILGFGITKKCKSKGNKFYEMMFRLGSEDVDYGEVHYGGQRDTVLIELKGVGCNLAKDGWEKRMHDFLSSAIRPRITRVDLALDFFDGQYSPEQAELDHDNGFFDNHNMRPKSERVGTAWRKEDGTGKTFYIGRKKNSRFVRVYEKGRQLGDKSSLWTRFEIQFNHGDIEIPLDILIDEGAYFCGAFPICASFENMPQQKRFEPREKAFNLTFGHKLKHGRNAVGKLVNFMVDLGFESDEIVKLLKADQGYPKGLEPEKYDLNELRNAEQLGFIHDTAHLVSDIELDPYDVLSYKFSEGFNYDRRLFDIEHDLTRRKKADEDYERWLQFKYEQHLPLEQRLHLVQERERKRISFIKRNQSIYREYYGRFVTYKKSPVAFSYCDF